MAELNLPEFALWWQVKFWEMNYKWNLETGCLEWQGKRHRNGYGRTSYYGTLYIAHRVAYFLYHGTDPGDLLVRHLCHNRQCGNPRHLALGTHLDNSRDMVEAGRNQSGDNHWMKRMPERLAQWKASNHGKIALLNGEHHPTTKLTPDGVRELRQKHRECPDTRKAKGQFNREMAEKFDVTQANIIAIVKGKSWKHVI